MKLFRKRYFISGESVEKLNEVQIDCLKHFSNDLNNGVFKQETLPCICGASNGVLVAKRERHNLPINTYLCSNCGMLWSNPQLTDESLIKYYSEVYRIEHSGNSFSDDDFYFEQNEHGSRILNFVRPFLPSQDAIIFDVGCGAGGIIVPFVRDGFHGYGCDFGKNYLQYGIAQGLSLVQGGVTALKQFGKADLIILSHVLEHFRNPIEELEKLSLSLNESGYIYVEVPGVYYVHKTYGDLLLYLHLAHGYHFTLKTLCALMSKKNFELVKGDESIRALFIKKSDKILINIPKENPKKVAIYIYLVEIYRIIIHPFVKLYRACKLIVKKLFIKLGLYGIIKRMKCA